MPSYPLDAHEYRYKPLGGVFTAWTTCTVKPIQLPNVAIAIDGLEVRVKAEGNRPASAVLTNEQAYTFVAPPVTNVNPTISLSIDDNSITTAEQAILTAIPADSDGTIQKVEFYGGATLIGTVNNAPYIQTVNGLSAGSYTFTAKAYDNDNASTTSSTVSLTVTAVPNAAPVASAGADNAITLPTNSVTLTGSGTDSDGTIASYSWSQVSGPNTATLSSATIANPTVSGLIQGNYVFRLTVTDNKGTANTDEVSITVNAAVPTATTYAFADSDFHDAGFNEAQTGYTRHTSFANVQFTTDATELTANVFCNVDYDYLEVFVDDVYHSRYPAGVSASTHAIAVTGLPAGSKKVTLLESGQSGSSPIKGVWVKSVVIPIGKTFTKVAPTVPADLIVVDGDSITVAGGADKYANGWTMLLRKAGLGHVVVNGIAGSKLSDFAFDSASITTHINRLVGLLVGTKSNKLVLEKGVNDMSQGVPADTYKQRLKAVIEGVRAARPDVTIYAQSLTWIDLNSNLPQQYRDAVTQIGTELPYVNVVNGLNLLDAGPAGFSDNVHPNTASHAILAEKYKNILATPALATVRMKYVATNPGSDYAKLRTNPFQGAGFTTATNRTELSELAISGLFQLDQVTGDQAILSNWNTGTGPNQVNGAGFFVIANNSGLKFYFSQDGYAVVNTPFLAATIVVGRKYGFYVGFSATDAAKRVLYLKDYGTNAEYSGTFANTNSIPVGFHTNTPTLIGAWVPTPGGVEAESASALDGYAEYISFAKRVYTTDERAAIFSASDKVGGELPASLVASSDIVFYTRGFKQAEDSTILVNEKDAANPFDIIL